MLSITNKRSMLCVVMLNVIMQTVVMPSVMAPGPELENFFAVY
jgi:hypothetical protein